MGNVLKCSPPTGLLSLQAVKIYLTFIAIASSTLTLLAIMAIYFRRHVQVLRIRRPWTIVATLIPMCVITLMACLKGLAYVQQDSGSVRLSCTGYWFAYAILNAVAFSALVVRGWIVIFMFNINQNYALMRKTVSLNQTFNLTNELNRKKNWYVENSKLLKSRYMFLTIFVVAWILVITVLIYFEWQSNGLTPGLTTSSCSCMTDYASYLFVDIPIGCVIVAATVILLRNLDSVSENFFLKDEMYNLAKIVVGTGVFVTLLFSILEKFIDDHDPTIVIILHITFRFFGPLVALLWVTVGRTVWLTFLWERVEENRISEENEMIYKLIPNKPSLGEMREEMFEMLFDERGFSLFREFLVKEFSVENLLFYRDVKAFREYALKIESGNVDLNEAALEDYQASMEERARRIYKEYCSDDAVLLVNLPFGIKNRLKSIFMPANESTRNLRISGLNVGSTKNISLGIITQGGSTKTVQIPMGTPKGGKKIGSDVFAEALTEITNLMCSDSFRRFRMMDEYKEYKLDFYQRSQTATAVDLRGNKFTSSKADEL